MAWNSAQNQQWNKQQPSQLGQSQSQAGFGQSNQQGLYGGVSQVQANQANSGWGGGQQQNYIPQSNYGQGVAGQGLYGNTGGWNGVSAQGTPQGVTAPTPVFDDSQQVAYTGQQPAGVSNLSYQQPQDDTNQWDDDRQQATYTMWDAVQGGGADPYDPAAVTDILRELQERQRKEGHDQILNQLAGAGLNTSGVVGSTMADFEGSLADSLLRGNLNAINTGAGYARQDENLRQQQLSTYGNLVGNYYAQDQYADESQKGREWSDYMTGKYGTVDQDVVGGFDPNSLALYDLPGGEPTPKPLESGPPRGGGATPDYVEPPTGPEKEAINEIRSAAEDAYTQALREGTQYEKDAARQALKNTGYTEEELDRWVERVLGKKATPEEDAEKAKKAFGG